MQEYPETLSSVDRRVRRTRHALQHAFLRLIQERGYEATSIQDICAAANVARSTFYLHYRSKEELKRAGLEHLKGLLLTQPEGANSAGEAHPLAFTLAMFEHAKDHLGLYRALVGNAGGSVALQTIRGILTELVQKDIHLPKVVTANPYAVALIVGAFMEILTNWLDRGAKGDPREVDTIFRRCILYGVAGSSATG